MFGQFECICFLDFYSICNGLGSVGRVPVYMTSQTITNEFIGFYYKKHIYHSD